MEWDYTVVVHKSWVEAEELRQNLTRAGKEGWELVSVVYNPEMATIISFLKRPLKVGQKAPTPQFAGHSS